MYIDALIPQETVRQRTHRVLDVLRREHAEALRSVVHAVPRERDPAQRPLVVLRLEPQVALAHDDHHRHPEHIQRAQAPDVSFYQRELLGRLCYVRPVSTNKNIKTRTVSSTKKSKVTFALG